MLKIFYKIDVYNFILIDEIDSITQSTYKKTQFSKDIFYSIKPTDFLLTTSVEQLTDTFTFTMSRVFWDNVNSNTIEDRNKIVNINNSELYLKEKMQIKFYCSHNENPPLLFVGYVSSISIDDNVVTVNCDDSMYLAKRSNSIHTTFIGTDLYNVMLYTKENLIDVMYDNTNNQLYTLGTIPNNEVLDMSIDHIFTANLRNASNYYDYLKDKYFQYIFFRLDNNIPKLYCGFKYPLATNYSKTYDFAYPYFTNYLAVIEKNVEQSQINPNYFAVIGNCKDDDKNENISIITWNGVDCYYYKSHDNNSVTIKYWTLNDKGVPAWKEETMSSIILDNTHSFTIPTNLLYASNDKKKEQFKYKKYNNKKEVQDVEHDTLAQMVLTTFKNYPISTNKGSITTFGEPYLRHGDIINLKIEDTERKYFVEKNTLSFSPSAGLKQNINFTEEANTKKV